MASSAVNVANPVSLPTSVQLAQIAANISTTLFNIERGQYGSQLDVQTAIQDLAAAVNCLAQSLITINNSTASSVGTVTVRNAYALGATAAIPTNINTSAV
jgi:hypothetical protein